jgi:hypothetical protein
MCNASSLANKGQICIPERCLADVDCTNGSKCTRLKVADIFGHCEAAKWYLQSGGDGDGWEDGPGCEMTPSVLVGKGAVGSACTDPKQCAPTCCSCDGGQSAALAALCKYGTDLPPHGTCGTPADACAAVFHGGSPGTCTAP